MLTKEEWNYALTARYGAKLQQRLEHSVVAVCGLGGLGSHIAMALARTGVGRLILIDFDRVELTNIHRQQYKVSQIGRYKTEALKENILEIAPFLQIEIINKVIRADNCAELLQDAQIICEALDKPESKAMLVNTVLEQMPGAYIVAASGMSGMGDSNTIKTARIMKRFYLCGDGISDVADGIGLVATRVMLCAAHQAHTVVRLLAGEL